MMTGSEFHAIRKKLGLSLTQWGRALGYTGSPNTLKVCVKRYEDGARDIPPWIERLAWMYRRHGVPERFLAE